MNFTSAPSSLPARWTPSQADWLKLLSSSLPTSVTRPTFIACAGLAAAATVGAAVGAVVAAGAAVAAGALVGFGAGVAVGVAAGPQATSNIAMFSTRASLLIRACVSLAARFYLRQGVTQP